MWCPTKKFRKSSEFLQDRIGGSGPGERRGLGVVLIHEQLDAVDKLLNVSERPALDGALTDDAEPTFDLIEPGRVSRREVNMESRPLSEPGADLGVFVCGVIIHHHMHVQCRWHVGFNVTQEGQEFLMTMPRSALANDRAGGDIEGREESRGAMSKVIVGHAFNVSESHRQDRLTAFEGLDLGLFIDTQDQGIIRGI